MEKILIKKDAKIPISLGVGFILRLQQLMVSLLIDRSKEEIQELNRLIDENKIPEDTWMFHYATIGILVSAIEQSAINSGLTIVAPTKNNL